MRRLTCDKDCVIVRQVGFFAVIRLRNTYVTPYIEL